MYPLGKQFEIDMSKSKSDDKCTYKGKHYRITMLSERLVRLEYSPSGVFVDVPSQFAVNRYFNFPEYQTKQDSKFLEITTKYFKLTYVKEAHFLGSKVDPMKNLKITLFMGGRENDRDWYYGHPEVRNLGGNMISEDVNTPKALRRGLYSLEGFASIDDSNSLLFNPDGTLYEREKGSLDIYVFMYKDDFELALKDYFKLTGNPELIPRYALGNWWSRNTTYNEESVKELVGDFERRNVPLAVFLLDKDWHYRNVGNAKDLHTGFTFNKELFPNPSEISKFLHEHNVRFGLEIDPSEGIYPHETYYAQACSYLGINGNKIIVFDPLNPKLLDVYFKLFLHPLESLGVDFFWHDYKGDNNPLKLLAYNHFNYKDIGRNPAKRNIMLSRNGIYAPHRYPILYAGETEVSWEGLKEISSSMMAAANIGVSFWSHDVGGNHGGIEESELYIRYVELGTFSPILRFHAARGNYYKREPWRWDIKTETIANDYLRLRHRLIPYLYTECYNYYKNAKVLIEPFYYKYKWVIDDNNYKYQYFLGSELLVCPILTKKDNVMNRTIHRFYIPEGVWYDFKTGKKFPGDKKYVSFYKEEDYPVFAKAGSVIPLSNRSDVNNVGLPLDMEIHIFPGVSNTYTLYEDDGLTSLYKEGYYLKTDIDYNYMQNNYTVIIRSVEGKSGIAPMRRNYKFRFRNTKKAESVTAHYNDQEIKIESMYIEENDFVVEVNNVNTIGQLTINCKGKDIEIDAVRLINEDIDSILMDLQISTYLKEKLAAIIFSDLPIKKKRIAIRKLRRDGLSKEHMKLFLKLMEYIETV